MSLLRVSKPTFYPDGINSLAARGWSKEDEITLQDLTADNKYKLFDENPHDVATFTCSGTSNAIIIEIDRYGYEYFPISFAAVMNTNLASAGLGGYTLRHHTAPITTASTGTELTTTLQMSLGKDYIGTCTKGGGSRYIALVLEPSSTWGADVTIGQVLIGLSYTLPVSGDLSIKTGFELKGIHSRTSTGGKTFASAGWVTGDDGDYMPFRNQTKGQHPAGRQYYEMSFSYISDSDLVPSDLQDTSGGNNLMASVISRTVGGLHPFIFSQDSSSTDETDYIYGRLDMDNYQLEQVAYRVYNTKMKIIQEI